MTMQQIDTSEAFLIRETAKAFLVEFGFGSQERQVWLPAAACRMKLEIVADEMMAEARREPRKIESLLVSEWAVEQKRLPVQS